MEFLRLFGEDGFSIVNPKSTPIRRWKTAVVTQVFYLRRGTKIGLRAGKVNVRMFRKNTFLLKASFLK